MIRLYFPSLSQASWHPTDRCAHTISVRFPVIKLYREKRFCRGTVANEKIGMARLDPSARAIPASSMSHLNKVLDANFRKDNISVAKGLLQIDKKRLLRFVHDLSKMRRPLYLKTPHSNRHLRTWQKEKQSLVRLLVPYGWLPQSRICMYGAVEGFFEDTKDTRSIKN